MDKEEAQKDFYRGWCSNEQIEKIFEPKSAEDELLKIRSEIICDHARLYRVMRSRLLANPENHKKHTWDFTEIFNDQIFNDYLNSVPNDLIEKAKITKGFVYSTDPNGACLKTDFCNIITISEALWHFLYFMNLAYLKLAIVVPDEVQYAARTIAIRTMLLTETQDFDIDPRGIVSLDLHNELVYHTKKQLFFIISHEYAHHFCDHLDDLKLIKREMIANAITSESL